MTLKNYPVRLDVLSNNTTINITRISTISTRIVVIIVLTVFIISRQAKSCAETTHLSLCIIWGRRLVVWASTFFLCHHHQHQGQYPMQQFLQQHGVVVMLLLLQQLSLLPPPAPLKPPH
jgi:hypothetical protein